MATIAALAEATLDETWVDVLRRLEAMSDLVHETYAVGASLLTTQRPVAYIDGYPTYDQYVRAVQRVCGPSVHPWVALAGVRSAALACMQSRTPIELARRSLDTFDPRSIPRMERPNHRLAVLLDGKFASCVAREHHRCQRRFGDAPWWQPAGGISLHPDSMDGEAGTASGELQLRLLADATDLIVAAGGHVAPFDSHHDDLRSLLTQAQALAPGTLPRIGALIESASTDLLHGGPLDSQTVSLQATPRRAAVLPYGSASGVSGQEEHAHIFVALTTTRRLESAFQLEGVPLPPGPVLAVVRNTIYDGDRRDMVLLQPVEDPQRLDDSVPVYVSVLSSAAGAAPELNETWSRSQPPSHVSLVMDTPVTASLRTWCRRGASFHTTTRVVEVGDDHIWLILGRVRAAAGDESPLVLIPTTEFGARWFEAARAEDEELGASVIDDDDLLDREGRHLDVLIHHTILEERSLGPGSWRR